MKKRVLFVDDEANILNAYKRALHSKYPIDTAEGGEAALKMIRENGPYAVIVSDMRMPIMDGIQFLSAAKKLAPDSVRMMLTGNADQQTAIHAINQGDIFRFMSKPCSPEILAKSLDAGLNQYQLVTAEKELLGKTLKGSIHALMEMLALVNQEAFGSTARIKGYVCQIGHRVGLMHVWWLETLAALSQIGSVILPESALIKFNAGQPLSEEETQLFEMYPLIGADLITDIPRMQKLSAAIRYQQKNFDGTGCPRDNLSGEDIPIGARVLKVALDFDRFQLSGLTEPQALEKLQQNHQWYDPNIMEALRCIVHVELKKNVSALKVKLTELTDDMIFRESVTTTNGTLIVAQNSMVTPAIKRRLRRFTDQGQLSGPFSVVVQEPEPSELPES
ncbi:MAG: response regulator [Gammaproteobacteria bacterium]|nr:response regulator [Gammaproteobacteria bacterium]